MQWLMVFLAGALIIGAALIFYEKYPFESDYKPRFDEPDFYSGPSGAYGLHPGASFRKSWVQAKHEVSKSLGARNQSRA